MHTFDWTALPVSTTPTVTINPSLVPRRYRHDNSETVGDDIGFTATDGTNAIDFVLHVDVGSFFNGL